MGTWGQSVTVVHGAGGRQGVQLLAVGYMKAGGPIHVHGAGGAATYSG